MDLKFEEYIALPKTVKAIQMTEKLWKSLRRSTAVEVGDNIITAYELKKEKLFMFGDSDDILSGGTNLHIGDWIVLVGNSIFLYTDEEFKNLFRGIKDVRE